MTSLATTASRPGPVTRVAPRPLQIRLRYALTALFPLGVLLTAGAWGEYLADALMLSVLASYCMGLFLHRITDLSGRTLMPLLVLAVLVVGHPLKAYFLAAVPWEVTALGPLSFVLLWVDRLAPEELYRAYQTGLTGLCVFCLMGFALIPARSWIDQKPAWASRVDPQRMTSALWVALALAGVVLAGLYVAAYKLGIMRMGVEPVRLPYRLGGVIAFLRQFFANYVLLLLLYLSMRLRSRRLTVALVVALLLNGAVASFLTGSRGALVMWVFPIVLLLITMGRVQLRTLLRPAWLAGALFVMTTSLVAHVWATEYRWFRTVGGVSDAEAVEAAVGLVKTQWQRNRWRLFSATAATISARITGCEHLLMLQGTEGEPNPVEASHYLFREHQVLGMYYTRHILGIDTLEYRMIPGLLGFFWIMGGLPAVAFGMVFYSLLLFGLNALYGTHLRLIAAPATLAVFAFSAISITSDGALLQIFSLESMVLRVAALVGVEMVARIIVRRGMAPA